MLVTRSLGLRNLESPGLSLQRPSAASCGADAALPCPFAAPEIPVSNRNRNAEKNNRMNRSMITRSPFRTTCLQLWQFWQLWQLWQSAIQFLVAPLLLRVSLVDVALFSCLSLILAPKKLL